MKRLVTTVCALIMCFSLAACGNKFNLEEYKSLISECQTKIENSFIPLGNMGKYEIKYMDIYDNLGGDPEPDKIVQSAQKWLKEKADITLEEIEEQRNSVDSKYKEILEIEVSGTEAEEIQKLFFELYEDYNNMHYNVTHVTLTPSDFANTTLDIMNNVLKNTETLKTLLV